MYNYITTGRNYFTLRSSASRNAVILADYHAATGRARVRLASGTVRTLEPYTLPGENAAHVLRAAVLRILRAEYPAAPILPRAVSAFL